MVLAIVVAIQLIRILRHIDHISEQAEDVAENIAGLSDQVKRGFRPVAIMSTVAELVGKFVGSKSKGKRKKGGKK